MKICKHNKITVLSLSPSTGKLKLICQECTTEVQVDVDTLPVMRTFLCGKEFVDQVTKEAVVAAREALKDYYAAETLP